MVASKSPPFPDFTNFALLLDIDGTILDIAPTPQTVAVPGSLRGTLRRLRTVTGGALAVVSGRSLQDLDRLFAPLKLPAVAGHGAEFRPYPGEGAEPNQRGCKQRAKQPLLQRITAIEPSLKAKIAAVAAIGRGIVIEDKGYAIAIHYRLACEMEDLVRRTVAEICADQPSLEILPGKFVIEVKPFGFNKATGVRDLMTYPPFSGRRPIFIGDDATDEYVFAIMPEFDGVAYSVGDAVGGVDGHFDGPPAVRDWLARFPGIKDHPSQ